MIKEIKEFKEIIINNTEVVVAKELYCDVCGKLINSSTNTYSNGIHPYEHYFNAVWGHHDWGNDSCESVEDFDICSFECLDKKYEEFKKEFNDSSTCYFNIDSRNF